MVPCLHDLLVHAEDAAISMIEQVIVSDTATQLLIEPICITDKITPQEILRH